MSFWLKKAEKQGFFLLTYISSTIYYYLGTFTNRWGRHITINNEAISFASLLIGEFVLYVHYILNVEVLFMFKLFSKAGNAMKRFLLNSGEDIYSDVYYDDDEQQQYQDHDYVDEPMHMHYTSTGSSRKPVEKSGRSRSSHANKILELGYTPTSGLDGHQSHGQPLCYPAIPAAVIEHPKDLNDAGKICEDVVNGRMVIVDLSSLESLQAQRIADYLGGVIHTIQGTTNRISKSIFAIAPKDFYVESYSAEDSPSKEYRTFRAVSPDR